MKKIIFALLVLLILCVLCCGGLFVFRGSIPFIKDLNLEKLLGITLNQDQILNPDNGSTVNDLAVSSTPSNPDNFNTTINDTNININNTDKTWPSDMPSSIPLFKYGTIKSVNKITSNEVKAWSVIFENVSSDAFAGYKGDLENKGFTDLNVIETTDGWTISTVQDNMTLIAGSNSAEGIATLTVSVEL